MSDKKKTEKSPTTVTTKPPVAPKNDEFDYGIALKQLEDVRGGLADVINPDADMVVALRYVNHAVTWLSKSKARRAG